MTLYAAVDQGLYIGKQAIEGEAATAGTLYGAKLITSGDLSMDSNVIDGVAGFGGGIYFDKSTRTYIVPKFKFDCRVTLDTLMAYLAAVGMRVTTGASSPYSHTFTPYRYNGDFPFFTIAMIYGQRALISASLLPVLVRDCKIIGLSFKIGAKDAITMSMEFVGRNSGKGHGTEVFTFDDSSHYPSPTISTNTFGLPSWMNLAGDLCVEEATYDWKAKAVTDIACIGKSEIAGVLITEAGWDISLKMPLNEASKFVWEGVMYGTGYQSLTNLQKSNLSSLSSAIPEGAHSFLMNSGEFITGTTPWSINGIFPSVQYVSANISGGNPLTVDVKARSFGYDWSMVVVNDKDSAGMTI
jgi:hypothetical protein